MIVGASESGESYLVWTGGEELRNFEVRMAYRIISDEANTGLHVRSKFVPDAWPYPLQGYQADIGHVGIGHKVLGAWDFHGEPQGDTLVNREYRVVIDEDGKKTYTPLAEAIAPEEINQRDWNDVRVVCHGNTLTYFINGVIASEIIDQETSKRVDRGHLGLQLHQGDSMKVQFRNMRLKRWAD